ncbi:MAG: site-2 protease family protein [Verrucomicrobia bacterium]|nr:site-2 protease family protein [Verrucomicrobiota bacterium]MBU6446486.1 site-2 protease family protein [Verrucomicrobiota bacterium]MDE3047004.1 site-2 protease family protein [Verrucomicrobiota bacterium]
MESLFYILLAILGLGFLVFIHELGHYLVARRKGMRVEAFAIGFGKPIWTWERDGVKWHICMLPFGGYVKIAGMQKEGSREPYEIADGFYGKKPMDRIWVALAGPLVNIGFAFLVFTFLWFSGGRNKQFFDYTHRIGWVDPQSALYAKGVRPGDLIEKYDGKPFTGIKDLLVASIMKGETTRIEGSKVDYFTGKKTHFDYTLKTYPSPEYVGKEKLNTIGVLSPASYLIYQGPNLLAGSPMTGSGLQPNDRILWADGDVLFSHHQLSSLTNDSTAFLTVQRGDQIFQTKVPRVQLADLKMTLPEKGELDDWQHEAGLKGSLQDLFFIPYNISPMLQVESRIGFIDEADQKRAFETCERCAFFTPLEENDRILAIDGIQIQTPYELMSQLQTRKVLLIVDRDPNMRSTVLWNQADQQFDNFSASDLRTIVSSIGTDHPVVDAGHLHLLPPVTPKPLSEISKHVGDEKSGQRLVLGLPLTDRQVRYNPPPQTQFVEVLRDTYHTLTSLFSGAASPKYMAGPVGIVQIVHHSWMIGAKEALFWMALISLNLGILNLLPLPVLDGGHILFSVIEVFTRRPLRAKTMERLIIPFVVLLIGFFIFVTYHDITRLFSKFF